MNAIINTDTDKIIVEFFFPVWERNTNFAGELVKDSFRAP